MANEAIYVIVQHSGFGYGNKAQFEQGLEVRQVRGTITNVRLINKHGGIYFDSYTSADSFTEDEMYPNSSDPGLTPQARGTFSDYKVDGLALYQPLGPDIKIPELAQQIILVLRDIDK